MKRRQLIGSGMTAEVFEWDNDKILKLYYDWIKTDFIKSEAEICKAIYQAGIPSPAIYEILDKEGRIGITFQKIIGSSMLKLIEEKPWYIFKFARQMAKLQVKIHSHSIDKLSPQKEIFINKITKSSSILGDRQKKILDYLERLPRDNNVCHGDFHPDNILVTQEDMIAIDWTNAYAGNQLSDVARTCIMITTPFMPSGISRIIVLFSKLLKKLLYLTYLKEYIKLSKVKLKDIDAWMLPVAAARLSENIPGEEKWLLNIIDRRLKRLNR